MFFFAGRKCVDLVVTFNEKREETFAVLYKIAKAVFAQNI